MEKKSPFSHRNIPLTMKSTQIQRHRSEESSSEEKLILRAWCHLHPHLDGKGCKERSMERIQDSESGRRGEEMGV